MDNTGQEAAYLAVEIGGTKLQLTVYTVGGRAIWHRRCRVNPGEGAGGIRRQILEVLPDIKAIPLKGTGVGFGGPVNPREGIICVSHQVPGWSGFPLAGWLGEQTGTPVWLENDANAAALGEACYGAGRFYKNVFYVTLGSGIGGGMVQDGKLYHGRLPGEAEVGHLRMGMNGSTLESQCSGWAVDAKVRAAVQACPESLLAACCPPQTKGGEARYLLPALQQACPLALSLLDEVAGQLSWGLSHVVHLFHPDILILGGGLSLLGAPLQEAVSAALPRFVMKAFQPPPEVKLAALGEEAVPLGALALILQFQNHSL